MVHLRLNTKEANPNPVRLQIHHVTLLKHNYQFVNFISALPGRSEDAAQDLLKALAAQVKPVMKDHGFTVNSFEEYEYNKVFLGRNWNAGETIELVLRRENGTFHSTSALLNTLCHELAHIKHMNHLHDFQRLWAQLRREVEGLRAKGYFGDGFWSSGTRLGDDATIRDLLPDEEQLPEYICGGAQMKAKKQVLGRRRRPRKTKRVTPSGHTGAQTEKKRKTGSRVSKNIFAGEGTSLVDEGSAGPSTQGGAVVGTGFRKQANSQKARMERAALAEKRILALQGKSSDGSEPSTSKTEVPSDSEDEDEEEDIPEDDSDRRRHLMDGISAEELEGLKCSLPGYEELGPSTSSKTQKNEPPDAKPAPPPLENAQKTRPKASDSSSKKTGWTCSMCTYVNPELYLSCEICTAVRE